MTLILKKSCLFTKQTEVQSNFFIKNYLIFVISLLQTQIGTIELRVQTFLVYLQRGSRVHRLDANNLIGHRLVGGRSIAEGTVRYDSLDAWPCERGQSDLIATNQRAQLRSPH